MRKFNTIIMAVLCISLIILTFCGCESKQTQLPAQQVSTETLPERHVREGIQTVLVSSIIEDGQTAQNGMYRNGKNADLIMLMVVDAGNGKTTALQLNPDTEVLFTEQGSQEPQSFSLGQVYSLGSGGSDSLLNLKKSVSKLLGGIPIDYYMSFTLDSIGIVNDLVGGVEVQVEHAFSSDNTEFRQGETLRLQGKDAVAFFGYRDEADITNEIHMACQQQYMAKLYSPFTTNMQDENFLTKLTMRLGDRLQTDLTLSQMVDMMNLMSVCPLDEHILTLTGKTEMTDHGYRFIADADAFGQIMDELFY